MALICDRCESKDAVMHTVVTLTTPGILGLFPIPDADPQAVKMPPVDLCAPCRTALRQEVAAFVRASVRAP